MVAVKMTAHDMRDLDLCYAPPFQPSHDPILISVGELWKKIGGLRYSRGSAVISCMALYNNLGFLVVLNSN